MKRFWRRLIARFFLVLEISCYGRYRRRRLQQMKLERLFMARSLVNRLYLKQVLLLLLCSLPKIHDHGNHHVHGKRLSLLRRFKLLWARRSWMNSLTLRFLVLDMAKFISRNFVNIAHILLFNPHSFFSFYIIILNIKPCSSFH